MKSEVTTLKQKVVIPASPKEVFDAFVDPEKHGEFTGAKATGKPVVGGKFTAWDGYIYGKFLELEDGKRVVQEWTDTDFPEGSAPSKLELCFNKTPKGTELVMIQSGLPKELADETKEGWTEWYWEPLKEYFTKGLGAKPKKTA